MKIKIIEGSRKDLGELSAKLGIRSKMEMPEVTSSVARILEQVRNDGDTAISRFTLEFDKTVLDPDVFRVRESEISDAFNSIDPELIRVMKEANANIMEFHKAQIRDDVCLEKSGGSYVKLVSRAIGIAGIYVPGGTAPLPS